MTPPLVVHVVYRLAVGGLENGLVNLINHTPPGRYRHAVVCMTDHSDFARRIQDPGVPVIDLHKREGHDLGVYRRMYAVFRRLRPAVVHTRNIGTLEAQLVARLAGVPHGVHGEHGRDMNDLDGTHPRHRLLRRVSGLWLDRFVALSEDIRRWLVSVQGIQADKIVQIYNGVDIQRFHPGGGERPLVAALGLSGRLLVGTVGRLSPEKDQLTLLQAHLRLLAQRPELAGRLALLIVGEGPLRSELQAILDAAPPDHRATVHLLGARDDVPALMREWDLFVLPSRTEGISNTILEAMASGLPVLATAVGGNPELVVEGETGRLVPRDDPEAMAHALDELLSDPSRMARMGQAGRARVEERFSIEAMVAKYLALYDQLNDKGV